MSNQGTPLTNGQTLPSLSVPRVGGGTLDLPGDLAGDFGVVLVYRGSWCPYCNAQLASFNRAAEKMQSVGIKVAALSVDPEEEGQTLVDKYKLSFPLGHSADADEVSETWGAYTNDDPHYLQSTGFVLAPDGTVVTAVYSSGAIGRLVADDVIGMVEYAKSQG